MIKITNLIGTDHTFSWHGQEIGLHTGKLSKQVNISRILRGRFLTVGGGNYRYKKGKD